MKSKGHHFTIAFYNLENLFDTWNNPSTNDDEFTPGSPKRWTPKRLKRKIYKLSTTISRIGTGYSPIPPVIVGISEVENRGLLDRMVAHPLLQKWKYRAIHFDSPDGRGMDTALLYMEEAFKPRTSEAIAVHYPDEEGELAHSRDVLYVEGLLFGTPISIYVNHWPSRREGVEVTEYRRIAAAKTLLKHLGAAPDHREDIQAKLSGSAARRANCALVLGDFNDRPNDDSIRMITDNGRLVNPFEALATKGLGSVSHRGAWYLFDQILLSREFCTPGDLPISFVQARIFNPKFLGQYRGKFKGFPFRTYVRNRYKGGYSDHFPVFVQLERAKSPE